MALENEVKRIADALEKIAEALGSLEIEVPQGRVAEAPAKQVAEAPAKQAEKPAKTEKETPPAEGKKEDGKAPDLDTVVKALQAYMQANGRDAAVELLGKYDAKRASDIAEDKRADFIKEAS